MDVYKNTYKQGYGGGCVLIAANSKEEAVRTYLADEDTEYEWYYYGEKTPETDFEHVSFHVFMLNDWEKVEGLHFDTQEPKLILDEVYCE